MTKNIWAVGRNFADHAKELGNPLPKEPMIFLKAGSSIQTGAEFALYSGLGEIHHEVELALLLDSRLEPSHFTISLDLTDRTAQTEAKEAGLPWTKAKSFKGACVLADWKRFSNDPGFLEQEIELKVNGEVRQKAPLSLMIFKPDALLTHIKAVYPVEPGDILLTGTPSGVGPIKIGDQIECRIGTVIAASWKVISKPA